MLRYLHERSIIYRDLKPENLICDSDGYLKMVDFGASKCLSSFFNKEGVEEHNDEFIERTFTMVGTPHYMAPEMLNHVGYTYSSDYWSFGIILFEIVCGFVPFGYDQTDVFQIYEAIQHAELQFPDDVEDQEIKNLISRLLNRSPDSRIDGTIENLMADPYYLNFDWDALINKTMDPPYVPEGSESGGVTSNRPPQDLKAQIKEGLSEFWSERKQEISRKGTELRARELDKYF